MLSKKWLLSSCAIIGLLSSASFAGLDPKAQTCTSPGFVRHVHEQCVTQCGEAGTACYKTCRHTIYTSYSCPDYETYPSQRYSRPAP